MTTTQPRIPQTQPFLACTPEELERLRDTLRRGDPEATPLTDLIKRAQTAMEKPVDFPPRGGQHNQWYQCDRCQLALKTIDATHHQCPKCGHVYSGEPYDDVLFSMTHNQNLRRALDAAWAYTLTGRAEFAADAAGVLLGYAERYKKYPYHDNARGARPSGGHINEQTLGEASMMATMIAPAFDLLCDGRALTDEQRGQIKHGLIGPMVENIAKHKAGKSNWQSWHNAALFAGGALLGDVARMKFTIDDPNHGFRYQMRVSVSAEGMWYENSWSYHAYTLHALTLHAEYARRCGIDLWSSPPLKKMFFLPVHYAMPDGSLPRFGDAVGRSDGANPASLEAAYHAYKADELLPLLPRKEKWESAFYGRDISTRVAPPTLASEVFPAAGHAILRSRGPAGLAAAITFGPYGGFHGHFDKLSFVLYGQGHELGVDPGRALSQAYRLPIHTNWYKATISHNAVLVDGKPQAPAEGRLLSFAHNNEHAVAVAACDKAYTGVTHRRLLYLGPDYALVLDDLTADSPRSFDWLYHNRGKSITVTPLPGADDKASSTQQLPPVSKIAGQEYVNWAFQGDTSGVIRAVVSDDGVNTHMIASGNAPTQVHAGDGVGASVEDRVPMLMLRRSGQRAVFAVVIEPCKGDQAPSVTLVRTQTHQGPITVTITRGGQADTVTLTTAGAASILREGKPALEATGVQK